MASIFEINNNTEIQHVCSNGTRFESDTADLRNGVSVFSDAQGPLEYGKDCAEFGAWHALQIHPHLNGFPGYDAIVYDMK